MDKKIHAWRYCFVIAGALLGIAIVLYALDKHQEQQRMTELQHRIHTLERTVEKIKQESINREHELPR